MNLIVVIILSKRMANEQRVVTDFHMEGRNGKIVELITQKFFFVVLVLVLGLFSQIQDKIKDYLE